ncbi:MAG: ATP-binding protein [Thermodesulfovibrionales bacterium]|nr:ATP-binding protein [Thermodesulfovibrionales bacterium]
MYSPSFFNYYRVGRFFIAIALLISFQMVGMPYAAPRLMFILFIYSFIAAIRLAMSLSKINYFDFLLDIIFISAMIHISSEAQSYLSLLYLFPIFFASILIRKSIYCFPFIAGFFYTAIHYLNSAIMEKENIFNISLHLVSFFLIAFAGDNLKKKLEDQGKYIKQLEEERIRMHGYEKLYRVSADLAHELRNPLASISAAMQFLKEGRNDKDFIDMLGSETKRLTNIVNDFLMFARPSDAPIEEVDLSEMLKVLAAHQDTAKKIMLNVIPLRITANRTFLEVAINNILKNAVEAANSTIRVSLKNTDKKEIAIEIEDDGPGISDAVKDKIFEPFVTTKSHGTGLGLAIANRMITGFGGKILMGASPSLGGAKFTVVFPVKEAGNRV